MPILRRRRDISRGTNESEEVKEKLADVIVTQCVCLECLALKFLWITQKRKKSWKASHQHLPINYLVILHCKIVTQFLVSKFKRDKASEIKWKLTAAFRCTLLSCRIWQCGAGKFHFRFCYIFEAHFWIFYMLWFMRVKEQIERARKIDRLVTKIISSHARFYDDSAIKASKYDIDKKEFISTCIHLHALHLHSLPLISHSTQLQFKELACLSRNFFYFFFRIFASSQCQNPSNLITPPRSPWWCLKNEN